MTRDEVLDEFGMEPSQDVATLGRYLAKHPEHAQDLVRLARAAAEPEPPDAIPRRCDLRRMCLAEEAITKAMWRVEEMAADSRLTAAVTALDEARSLVADYVDGIER